jgi:hypothetical protein
MLATQPAGIEGSRNLNYPLAEPSIFLQTPSATSSAPVTVVDSA